MTTLITGGIGWVPSHITRAIAATGEKVVTYDLARQMDLGARPETLSPDSFNRLALALDTGTPQ